MHPDIYFFNPTCEPAIANGSPYYTAPALLRKFEADLGYLPGWLGEDCDQVLVQGAIDPDFEDRMKALGFRLPRFLTLQQVLADTAWMSDSKGTLRPWGWSPAVVHLFRNVIPSCNEDFRNSSVAKWQPGHKNLYSRLTAIGLLNDLLSKSNAGWLPNQTDLPVVCNSLDQIQFQLNRHDKAVVKSPWSSSGRGLLLFPNVDSKKKNDELLSGMLNQQGFVTVERWLEKVADLSYQFMSHAGKIRYRGRTFFDTDPKGRYISTFLKDNPDTPKEISGFIEEHDAEVIDLLVEALSKSGYSTMYEGWIGVDTMICKSDDGSYLFHPMVEINGRYTMGAVALMVSEHLEAGSNGSMRIFYSKTDNFQAFCQKKEAEKPLVMKGQKIVSGFLPLTPPLPGHHFGAYIEVENHQI